MIGRTSWSPVEVGQVSRLARDYTRPMRYNDDAPGRCIARPAAGYARLHDAVPFSARARTPCLRPQLTLALVHERQRRHDHPRSEHMMQLEQRVVVHCAR